MLGKKIKTILKIIKNIVVVILILILGLIAIQKFTGNNINLFGYTMYTVGSESMLPEYEIGDMFLSKKVDVSELKVGDDIVYMGKVGTYANKIITHRIIRISKERIITKGINNPVEDAPIEFNQVLGKAVIRLYLLSIFSKLMNNSVLFYTVVFVPFALLIFFDIKGMIDDKNKLENINESDVSANNQNVSIADEEQAINKEKKE